MKIKMTKIVDRGTQGSEKVLLDVLEDANLKYYIVRDTTYHNDETISNEWFHAYKFPSQDVKAGDKVVLFTKEGTNHKNLLANGKTEYVYFWRLKTSVWNNDGDAAALYEVNTWQHLPVNIKK